MPTEHGSLRVSEGVTCYQQRVEEDEVGEGRCLAGGGWRRSMGNDFGESKE